MSLQKDLGTFSKSASIQGSTHNRARQREDWALPLCPYSGAMADVLPAFLAGLSWSTFLPSSLKTNLATATLTSHRVLGTNRRGMAWDPTGSVSSAHGALILAVDGIPWDVTSPHLPFLVPCHSRLLEPHPTITEGQHESRGWNFHCQLRRRMNPSVHRGCYLVCCASPSFEGRAHDHTAGPRARGPGESR